MLSLGEFEKNQRFEKCLIQTGETILKGFLS